MASYDSSGKKVGRNDPCFCGSGKKFKRCHERQPRLTPIRPEDVPEEVWRKFAENKAKHAAFQEQHGRGRPIMSAELADWRFVFVGNEVQYSHREKTKYFPDFLTRYLGRLLGGEWAKAEAAKPYDDRHQIVKWYESMCRHQRGSNVRREEGGGFSMIPTGAMLSWFRLAYDFYLINHNAKLQNKILERLKDKGQFQGARFELCVTAAMISAGLGINYEDESDNKRKHTEFLATEAGVEISVEAKSRHRHGILGFADSSRWRDRRQTAVAVEAILRKALAKKPGRPFFIFIDLNLPYSEELINGNPWFKEISNTVKKLESEYLPGAFPANAVFFCNDPTFQAPEETSLGNSFWCYEAPIRQPLFPFENPNLTITVAESLMKRANIPIDFPDS